jgi:lipoprotein
MVKDNSFFKKSFYLLAVIGLSASMIIGCNGKTENNSEDTKVENEELQTAIIYANKDDIMWELLVKNISANIYKMFGDYERAETTYALNIYDFPNYIATYVPYAEILKDYSGDKDLSWDAKMMKKDLMNIPNIENNQTYINNKALFDEVFTKYGATD